MSILKHVLRMVIVGVLVITLPSCTWNPFGDEDITSGYRTISGNVELNDGSDPDGVYVWLEGFNVGTYTDGSGKFTLSLPNSGSSDLNGIYKLYFYIANYTLVEAQVVVRDGEFVYSRGDINKDGKLALPIVLRRFLRIVTSLSPESVPQNYTENIIATVTLTATVDSVTVVVPQSIGSFILGAVLIRKIDSQEVFIHESSPYSGMNFKVLVSPHPPKKVSMGFSLILKPLTPGEYEVIPYLLPCHQKVPAGLFETMGPGVSGLSQNYLKIPFKRTGGEFEVR